jgi:predicted permease
LSELLVLFSNNILPIFLAASGGFLIAKLLKVSPRPVSQTAFYIFSPCLIFNLLTTSELSGSDITRMVLFTILSILAIGALTWLVGKFLRLERRMLAAVLITSMFNNSGNYGLSLNLFAFGETALAHASLYFVTMAIMVYSLGVIIASLGNSSIKQSMIGLFKVPALYAVVLALLFNFSGWQLPLYLNRTVSLLGDAAIPVLMVLMGIQLGHAQWQGQTGALTLSNLMRLVAGPAVALGLSLVFGLNGFARQAGIIESATPTAVVTTVLATEYNVEPSFVSTVVVVSTLLSPLTVTPLLAYLGA